MKKKGEIMRKGLGSLDKDLPLVNALAHFFYPASAILSRVQAKFRETVAPQMACDFSKLVVWPGRFKFLGVLPLQESRPPWQHA